MAAIYDTPSADLQQSSSGVFTGFLTLLAIGLSVSFAFGLIDLEKGGGQAPEAMVALPVDRKKGLRPRFMDQGNREKYEVGTLTRNAEQNFDPSNNPSDVNTFL